MKHFLLTLLLVIAAAIGLRAQDIQITNGTACDLYVKAYYGTPPCMVLGSIVTFVPTGTPAIYLTAPSGSFFLYADIFDCGGVIGTVGDPAAGCAPASATPVVGTSCGPGGCSAGSVFNASASSGCALCPTAGWVLELY